MNRVQGENRGHCKTSNMRLKSYISKTIFYLDDTQEAAYLRPITVWSAK